MQPGSLGLVVATGAAVMSPPAILAADPLPLARRIIGGPEVTLARVLPSSVANRSPAGLDLPLLFAGAARAAVLEGRRRARYAREIRF